MLKQENQLLVLQIFKKIILNRYFWSLLLVLGLLFIVYEKGYSSGANHQRVIFTEAQKAIDEVNKTEQKKEQDRLNEIAKDITTNIEEQSKVDDANTKEVIKIVTKLVPSGQCWDAGRLRYINGD